VPQKLLLRTVKARNNVTVLPYETSLLEIRATLLNEKDVVVKDGVRIYPLATALIACGPRYFV